MTDELLMGGLTGLLAGFRSGAFETAGLDDIPLMRLGNTTGIVRMAAVAIIAGIWILLRNQPAVVVKGNVGGTQVGGISRRDVVQSGWMRLGADGW